VFRIGIDSYSYHRLLGGARPGERVVEATFAGRPEALVAEARGAGAELLALETMFLPAPAQLDVEALLEAADGMELALSWGGMEGLAFGRDAAAAVDLEAWLACAALGVSLVRVVVGGPALRGSESVEAQLERTAPVLARLAAAAAEAGVTLAVENHGDLASRELATLLERTDVDNVGACFDTANAVRLGEDPVQAGERLGRAIRMVHLKDCGPPGDDLVTGPVSMPYGTGIVDLDGVLRGLARVGFDGPACIELGQLPASADERALVAADLGWLRTWRETMRGIVR
jgi:3-oxoisoapionate decarboxylase